MPELAKDCGRGSKAVDEKHPAIKPAKRVYNRVLKLSEGTEFAGHRTRRALSRELRSLWSAF